MIFADQLSLAVLLLSVGLGAWRGWISQVLSMLGFIGVFFLTRRYGPVVSDGLPLGGQGEFLRPLLGGGFVLLVTLFCTHSLTRLHQKLFVSSGTQPAHRILGGGMGFISGCFFILALATIIELTQWRESPWWQRAMVNEISMGASEHLKHLLAE